MTCVTTVGSVQDFESSKICSALKANHPLNCWLLSAQCGVSLGLDLTHFLVAYWNSFPWEVLQFFIAHIQAFVEIIIVSYHQWFFFFFFQLSVLFCVSELQVFHKRKFSCVKVSEQNYIRLQTFLCLKRLVLSLTLCGAVVCLCMYVCFVVHTYTWGVIQLKHEQDSKKAACL